MKTRCAIAYLVSVFAVVLDVQAKSIIFNKYNSGPHYETRKQTIDFDYDELHDDHLDNIFGYKRSADDIVHPFKRSIFGGTRKRSPYGLVYNQGKPIGILEPIGQAFEYASYPAPREVSFRNPGFKSQWYPAKRESLDFDLNEQDKEDLEGQASPLHNSNYANVLAKFKVNNKVKQRPYQDFMYAQQVKRDVFNSDQSTGSVNAGDAGREQRDYDPSGVMPSSSASDGNGMTSLLDEPALSAESDTSSASRKKESREELKKRGALDLGDVVDEQQVVKIDSTSKPAAKTKRKTEDDKLDRGEQSLKSVLEDLNLVEKENGIPQKDDSTSSNSAIMKKREIYFEDEDLENGLNKIGLTKESHYDRNKKEDSSSKAKIVTKSLKNVKKTKVEKSIHKKGKKKSKKESDESKQRIVKSAKRLKGMNGDGFKTSRIANYQLEGEEFIRKKRQAAKDIENDDSDIMKGLESSGDLTVSGNKSPLVAVSNDESEKKSQEKRDKEELEYEKRLERNIEAKINAIKEEVKREISELQNEDERGGSDPQRKKREISINNNLMDEESSVLDPGINIEGDLEPHIRRRRDADSDNNKRVISEKTQSEDEGSMSGKVSAESGTADTEDHSAGETRINDDNVINKNEDGEQLTSIVDQEKDEEGMLKSKSSDNAFAAKSEDSSLLNKRQQPINEEAEFAPTDKPLEKRAPSSSQADSNTDNEDDDKNTNDADEDEDNDKEMVMKRNEKKAKERAKIENNEKDADDKNVDKRATKITETDKLETDIKADLATDAPESIVKRDRDSVELTEKERADIDAVISDANNIVKRNEESLTTEKFVAPREGAEPVELTEADAKDELRQERSVDAKPNDLKTTQALLNNDKGESSKRIVKSLKTTNDASSREQRSPQQSSNKSIAERGKNEKLRKRSSVDSKVPFQELDKPAASKSVILNEQDMGKETGIEERSAKNGESDKDMYPVTIGADQRTEKSDLNLAADPESTQIDKEDQQENEYRNVRKTADDNEGANLETKNEDREDLEVTMRRRRSLYDDIMRRNARRKRDGTWNYQRNQEAVGYRADDGEIDDEDDEMQDDGFDDQTSNMLNKRQVVDYEGSEDQDSQDYPTYMERNKRNALRLYDDETDADESFDNFLFYPNRYSRHKRHNVFGGGEEEADGGGMEHARGERMRRKRLEQQRMGRLRNSAASKDMASLSEADIFGGLPQSYEGELSRFKRVKRSRNPDAK